MEAFSALKGDRELNRRYTDLGYLPWWTPEDFRLAFFRPLTLATVWLDYRLWSGSPVLMHAHSLLWFAALVVAAAFLYRRIVEPAWVAGLAALLYALDDAHAAPAAWLANRNALLATFFGVLCLVVHDRWRRDGWRPGIYIAPALLGLGLLSGEAALAATGFLFAHALFLDPGRSRLRPLLPYAPVVVAWAGLYRLRGFGAIGSGLYLDPLQSPGAYGVALLRRAPFSLMGQWTPLPADLGSLLPASTGRLWWLVAVGLLLILAAALLSVLRRDRTARFWASGMMLSLLPISATFPSNRLLFFVGLGAMGLVARYLQETLTARRGDRAAHSFPLRGLAWALVIFHLVLAPLFMPLGAVAIRQMGDPMLTAAASLGTDPRIADQDLVIVSSPDHLMFVTNLPTLQVLGERPVPRRLRALSTGPTAIELARVDARSLRVDLERGLFAGPLGRLFRSARRPFAPGDTTRLTGFEAEVVASAPDGSPTAILYRFAQPLDDPSLRWVRWQEGRYIAFEPPAVGDSISLPPAIGPLDRFGW